MTDPLYLQIAGADQLVLVVSYADGSGVTNTFGPFADQDAVDTAKEALLEAGIDMGRCDVLPLRGVVSKP